MLKPALLVSALTLLALALLLVFLPPRTIATPENISFFAINQKVSASGTVVVERSFSSEKRFTLASGIEVRCSCQLPPLKNKRISIKGTLQRYQNKTWIEAYSLEMLP